MKKFLFPFLAALVAVQLWAFDRAQYYRAADGLKGEALRSALEDIINPHTQLSYNALWTAYYTTDVRADGKIWDMYSDCTSYAPKTGGATYSGEGDCYNREHSFPKSWFNDEYPMYTDLYHLYPTDGYVNGRRSNYCYGNVATATYESHNAFSRLGSPTAELRQAGCKEGTVFEPNDLYKGDLARTYFYMLTSYRSRVSSWTSGMLSGGDFAPWACQMLLRWAQGDPVSQKETDRIEAVYDLQHNRNPFIDFPGLEQYIWGTAQDVAFSVADYQNPYTTIVVPDTITPDPDEPVVPDTLEAGETLWHETFDQCDGTGGNDGLFSGSIATGTITADLAGWEFTSGSKANQCVRLGTSSKRGSALTPELGHAGTLVLTFRAAAWHGDAQELDLRLEGQGTLSQDTVVMLNEQFQTYQVTLRDVAPSTRLLFEASATKGARFFLDEVSLALPTAVRPVVVSTRPAAVYTLDGRRVDRPARRGIYIVNGRKVVAQ